MPARNLPAHADLVNVDAENNDYQPQPSASPGTCGQAPPTVNLGHNSSLFRSFDSVARMLLGHRLPRDALLEGVSCRRLSSCDRLTAPTCPPLPSMSSHHIAAILAPTRRLPRDTSYWYVFDIQTKTKSSTQLCMSCGDLLTLSWHIDCLATRRPCLACHHYKHVSSCDE